MNWYKIATANNKKILVWKHHIKSDFLENGVPTKGNGVGKGGTVFFDFNYMKSHIDNEKFFVCPIFMNESEIQRIDNHTAISFVSKISDFEFASLNYWSKNELV